MKKSFFLCLLFLMAVTGFAEKYRIVKLSTPTIVIGGKVCQEGNEFSDGEVITWTDDEQGLWARNLVRGTYNYFAAKAFKSHKCKTAFEYLRTNKMSTRSGGFDLTVERTVGSEVGENRIALVIGNANYMAEKNLCTPIPDAISISKKLSELGFNVYVVFDAGKSAMNEAIKKFCNYATNYETALVYYAGHGNQFNGDTYLIPVDAVVETSYDVTEDKRWIPTKRIVSFLNDVRSLKTRLMLIDACRTPNKLLASRGDTDDNMLNTDELNEGIVFYSTKYGYEAYDDDGRTIAHSPFSSAIIKHIATPNISVGDFVTDVMNEVKAITSVPPYPHPQEPRSIPTLTHRFYFNPVQEEQTAKSVVNRMFENVGNTPGGDSRGMAVVNPTTPEGFYEMGMNFYQQNDFTKAVPWFIKSAAANYAPAQAMLGICYHEGEGVKKDYSIALDYYEKAAKKNNGRAMNGLGRLYEHGMGVEKNIKKAIKYYNRAAKVGYGAGYYNLGCIFYDGNGVKEDDEKAFDLFAAGAEINHPSCTGLVAYCYEHGIGTPVNMSKAIEYYNKGVQLGDELSAYFLGIFYRDGNNGIKSPQLAAELFAKCSSEFGIYELGKCYRDGFGVDKNVEKAADLFRKAAEKGYADAQYEVGVCYLYGRGVDKNEQMAVTWYEKAALQGNAYAQNSLGYCYDNGIGVDTNYQMAVAWFRKSSDQDNSVATDNLGLCYEYGKGVVKNPEEAFKWYSKAATLGSIAGLYHVGYCYENGVGVQKSMKDAVVWYKESAERGGRDAQYRLGLCYENGSDIPQDYVEAVKWFKKAADRGQLKAMSKLAYCYFVGRGIEKNPQLAFQWWKQSADQGYDNAQFNIGFCYEKGEGVTRSYTEAVKWYREAAEQGYASAQFNLAICYEQGKGVMKSIEEAVKWYRKAANQGDADAMKRLKELTGE